MWSCEWIPHVHFLSMFTMFVIGDRVGSVGPGGVLAGNTEATEVWSISYSG